MTRARLLLLVAVLCVGAAEPAQAAKKARARARANMPKAAAAPAPAKSTPAPEAAHTPLAIEDVEIHGERLVPQAIYIVGGAEADTEAAASVSDYLALLGPATDRMPAALFMVPERR